MRYGKTPLHGFFYLFANVTRRRGESLQWPDISMILFVGQYLSLEKIVRLSEAPEQSSLKSIYDIFLIISSEIFRMYSTKPNQIEAWRLDMIQSMCHIRAHAPHDVKTCFRQKVQVPLWSRQRGLIVTGFGVIVNVGGQALCYRQYDTHTVSLPATQLCCYFSTNYRDMQGKLEADS